LDYRGASLYGASATLGLLAALSLLFVGCFRSYGVPFDTQCMNDCTQEHARDCANDGAWRECIMGDDGCLEWGAEMPCPPETSCAAGVCVAGCEHECEVGETVCESGGLRECGDSDGDGCRELLAATPCPDDQVCVVDECEPSCVSDCDDSTNVYCVAPGAFEGCVDDGTGCFRMVEATECPDERRFCEEGECRYHIEVDDGGSYVHVYAGPPDAPSEHCQIPFASYGRVVQATLGDLDGDDLLEVIFLWQNNSGEGSSINTYTTSCDPIAYRDDRTAIWGTMVLADLDDLGSTDILIGGRAEHTSTSRIVIERFRLHSDGRDLDHTWHYDYPGGADTIVWIDIDWDGRTIIGHTTDDGRGSRYCVTFSGYETLCP